MQFLYLAPLLQVAMATTCYSPSVVNKKLQFLRQRTYTSQLECDSTCNQDSKCHAIAVERKSDHVICRFFTIANVAFTCSKPIDVYKKHDCLPSDLAGVIVFLNGVTAPAVTVNTDYSLARNGTDYIARMVQPTSLNIRVIQLCELHFLLSNKTTIVRKYQESEDDTPHAEYIEDFDGVSNVWSYCKIHPPNPSDDDE